MITRVERRRHLRVDAARVSDVCGRIRPGHAARVMNLSAGGALIETARRLVPGGVADLHLESGELRHETRVRVVRSSVSRVLPDAMFFRCAVTFDRTVPWLPELPSEASAATLYATGLEPR